MSSITRVGISSGCNTTTSSSIVRSPYSLRRNQRTSDSVVKRTVSRHRNVSISRSRSVCATDASSARQEVDRSQEPSANAEETDSPDDNGEMERSDNETDAPLRAHRERRATTQLAVVINQFDRVGEQEYLCEICKKVRIA